MLNRNTNVSIGLKKLNRPALFSTYLQRCDAVRKNDESVSLHINRFSRLGNDNSPVAVYSLDSRNLFYICW